MLQDNPDPQVVPYLLYADAGAAMDWLIKVFGFTAPTSTGARPGRRREGI